MHKVTHASSSRSSAIRRYPRVVLLIIFPIQTYCSSLSPQCLAEWITYLYSRSCDRIRLLFPCVLFIFFFRAEWGLNYCLSVFVDGHVSRGHDVIGLVKTLYVFFFDFSDWIFGFKCGASQAFQSTCSPLLFFFVPRLRYNIVSSIAMQFWIVPNIMLLAILCLVYVSNIS